MNLSRQDTTSTGESNLLEQFLDALPAGIAKEKRALIQAGLEEAGMWEHYRQNISKPGKDIGKIAMKAAVIFKRHLNLTDEFFIGTTEFREEELKRLVRQYYDQLV